MRTGNGLRRAPAVIGVVLLSATMAAIPGAWDGAAGQTAPGAVVAWGRDGSGQSQPPPTVVGDLDVVDVGAGRSHNVALGADGTVVAWGGDDVGQADVPDGLDDVVEIAVGWQHTLVRSGDGTVVGWGSNDDGETSVPEGLTGVVAIAAGGGHSLAVTEGGTVVGWGSDGSGEATPPAGLTDVVAVAAGSSHSLALRADGTVVAWGDDIVGEGSVPAGVSDVVAIAAGANHNLVVHEDGTVTAWGGNEAGQSDVPDDLTDVVAVAAGYEHSLALRDDGTVVAWGDDRFGQATVPDQLTDVVAVASGLYHNVVVRRPVVQDASPPTVSIATPRQGAAYVVGQAIRAEYTCDDGPDGSGVATCTATVDGRPLVDHLLPTDAKGVHTLTVTATDHAGNTTTATRSYTVFPWLGHAIDPGTVNEVRAGRTVPVVVRLDGYHGRHLLADGSPSSQRIDCDTGTAVGEPVEVSSSVSQAQQWMRRSLRPVGSHGTYVLLWRTERAWAGTCRTLTLRFADDEGGPYAGAEVTFRFHFDDAGRPGKR